MTTLTRPNWDTAIKYVCRGHVICPVRECGRLITDRKNLQKCWMDGHLDGLTEADCSEPAPRSTMIYIQPEVARIVLVILTLASLLIGGIAGAGLMRLIR